MKLVLWVTPNARATLSHFAGRACCQSHLLKTTQMDSEAYLQEMHEDNKVTSLDQKLQSGCIMFSLFSPINI